MCDKCEELMDRAREAVASGDDTLVAAYLLGVPVEHVQRVSGRHPDRDRVMSCPCGRGEYSACTNCPCDWCSVHGKKGAIRTFDIPS